MLVAGSDDGVYRIADVDDADGRVAEKVSDAGRVMRVRTFDGGVGVFAASETGLYHSTDGATWTDLQVPRDRVYAVTASPDGDRLYAGTRPAHLYATSVVPDDGSGPDEGDWTELAGFRELPGADDWGLERHDHEAQVRSLRVHSDAPDRVVAGVEVGGVHVSEDRGETWTPRRIEGFDAPHTDDIHHLLVSEADTFVASTGSGLYRTTDAGRSWRRLDRDHDRRYFRGAYVHDGRLYAGGAPGSSSSWADSTHALFVSDDGRTVESVSYPRPEELIIHWCETPAGVACTTHRGTVLALVDGDWRHVGRVPVPGDVGGGTYR
ncbi:MAG: WD40 repeat domain-containing protein [Halobacteriales archaeon]